MKPAAPGGKAARLAEIARLFTRLGFTAFGGPAAHVAMMEDEIVTRRKWIDRQHFLDLLASVNFIPGPNSTELAIHVGLVRAGLMGMAVAGVCFIVPAVLIILPLAFLYVRYGSVPQVQPAMRGIGAAVVAIVAVVTLRLVRSTLKDATAIALACGALAIALCASAKLGPRILQRQPELLSLALAALVGFARATRQPRVVPPLAMLPMAIPTVATGGMGAMAMFFLKIGATMFGSGYVLISYLQSGLVDERHWLTSRQLLDAVAVGQFTPGPLLTTATFIGYLLGADRFGGGTRGGVIGAIVATVAIFSPSFIFVAMLGPVFARIRSHPSARAVLDALNAAVTGLISAVCVRLFLAAAIDSSHVRSFSIVLIAGAMVALWRGINATWIILAGGVIGAAFAGWA